MAYLNANIPVQYAQIKKEYLYDLKKHQGEVEDCIIFGITSLQDVLSYSMPSWKTVLSFIVYPYRLLFNVVMNPSLFHPKDLMNWNLWNSFSYYPAVTTWDILSGHPENTLVKIKNGIMVSIYLPLTGDIQMLIY